MQTTKSFDDVVTVFGHRTRTRTRSPAESSAKEIRSLLRITRVWSLVLLAPPTVSTDLPRPVTIYTQNTRDTLFGGFSKVLSVETHRWQFVLRESCG